MTLELALVLAMALVLVLVGALRPTARVVPQLNRLLVALVIAKSAAAEARGGK